MNNSELKVFSGRCCLCDVGIATNEIDMHGNQLHTGDIVQLWHGHFIGTDLEEWHPSTGLTVIVADQYKTYTDGAIEPLPLPIKPFTMGIKDCGVQNHEWKVTLVKSHSMLVNGEKLIDFGFSFRCV